LYFIVVTITTVGYGDISPSSDPGKVVIVLLILFSLAYVPGLVSNVVDTINDAKAGQGQYVQGQTKFIVLFGDFDNLHRLVDLISIFFDEVFQTFDLYLQQTTSDEGIQLVLVLRSAPSSTIKSFLSNSLYSSRVQFFTGSPLVDADLERVLIRQASAIFLMSGHDQEGRLEDEHNTLRAYAIEDFAPDIPLYVYHSLESTSSVLKHSVTESICIDSVKQAMMGYSCLYEGLNTFIVNLLHQTEPRSSYSHVWEAQYGDGSGNEVYSGSLNPVFTGMSFTSLSFYIFREFSVTLFGIKKYCPQKGKFHVFLNPGKEYKVEKSDELLYLSQNGDLILELSHLVSCLSLMRFRQRLNSTRASTSQSQSMP
jgi:voltage-gated potassium channel Kch